MSATSSIEWTDRTWNPVRGCSVISPGCVNCYAMKQAHRFSGPGKPYEGLTKLTKAGPQWTGQIKTVDAALREPLSWRTPARVFVNSMSDLFHENVPDAFIADVFATMAKAPQHTFQILTKRADRMREWVTNGVGWMEIAVNWAGGASGLPGRSVPWPLPNVWLGVSVENQEQAIARIPQLLQTPAAVRFISAEPLLGPVTLNPWLLSEHGRLLIGAAAGLSWVIVGGESGSRARPCDINWIRSIAVQCHNAGVPVFVKQLGKVPTTPSFSLRDGFAAHVRASDTNGALVLRLNDKKGGDMSEWPEDLRVRQFPRGARC